MSIGIVSKLLEHKSAGWLIDKFSTALTDAEDPVQQVTNVLVKDVLPNKDTKKIVNDALRNMATNDLVTSGAQDAKAEGGKFSDGLDMQVLTEKLQPIFELWEVNYKPTEGVSEVLENLKNLLLPDRSHVWPQSVVSNFVSDCELQAAYKTNFKYDNDTKKILFAYSHSQLCPSFLWAVWESDKWDPFEPREGQLLENSCGDKDVYVGGQTFSEVQSDPVVGIRIFRKESEKKVILRFENPSLGHPNTSPLHDNIAWCPGGDVLVNNSVDEAANFPVSGVLEFIAANPASDNISSRDIPFVDQHVKSAEHVKWNCRPYVNELIKVVRERCTAEVNQQAFSKQRLDDALDALDKIGDPEERSLLKDIFLTSTGHDAKPPPEAIARALTFQLLSWERPGANAEEYFVSLTKTTTTTRSPHLFANTKTKKISKVYRLVSNYWPEQLYNLSNQATRLTAWGSPNATCSMDGRVYEATSGDFIFHNNTTTNTVEYDVSQQRWTITKPDDGTTTSAIGKLELQGWLMSQFKSYVYHTHIALELVSQKGDEYQKTYRGMRGQLSRKMYALGSTVTWPQTSSSTYDQGVAAGFASGKDNAVIFTLKTNKGAMLEPISRFARESEVLLKLNTCFKVTSELSDQHSEILGKSGIQLFDLEEISNTERIAIHARRALAQATDVSSCTVVFEVIRMINEHKTILDLSPKANGIKTHIGDSGAMMVLTMIELGIPMEGFNLQKTGISCKKVIETALSIVASNRQIGFAKLNSPEEAISLVSLSLSCLVSLRAELNRITTVGGDLTDEIVVSHVPSSVAERQSKNVVIYESVFRGIRALPVLAVMHLLPLKWDSLKEIEWLPLPKYPLHRAAGEMERAVVPLVTNLSKLSKEGPQQDVSDDDNRLPIMVAIKNNSNYMDWAQADDTLKLVLPSAISKRQSEIIIEDCRTMTTTQLKRAFCIITKLLETNLSEDIDFWKELVELLPELYDLLSPCLQNKLRSSKPQALEGGFTIAPIPLAYQFFEPDYTPTGKHSTMKDSFKCIGDLCNPFGEPVFSPEWSEDYFEDSEYRVWEAREILKNKYSDDTIRAMFLWCQEFTEVNVTVEWDGNSWSKQCPFNSNESGDAIPLLLSQQPNTPSGYTIIDKSFNYDNPFPEDRRLRSYKTGDKVWLPTPNGKGHLRELFDEEIRHGLNIPFSGVINKLISYQLDVCFESSRFSTCPVSTSTADIDWSVTSYDGPLADQIKELTHECKIVTNQNNFSPELLQKSFDIFNLTHTVNKEYKTIETVVFANAINYGGETKLVTPQVIIQALEFQQMTWMGRKYLLTNSAFHDVVLGNEDFAVHKYSPVTIYRKHAAIYTIINATMRAAGSGNLNATVSAFETLFSAAPGETEFTSDLGSKTFTSDMKKTLQINAWYLPKIKHLIYFIERALADIRSHQSNTEITRVYRTLRVTLKHYETDALLVWNSFSPTSPSKAAADKLASKGSTIFLIDGTSSVDVSELEVMRYNERIFAPNTFFRIKQHVDGSCLGENFDDAFVLEEITVEKATTNAIRNLLASGDVDLDACEVAFSAIKMVNKNSDSLNLCDSQIRLQSSGVLMIDKLLSFGLNISSIDLRNSLVQDAAALDLMNTLIKTTSSKCTKVTVHAPNEDVSHRALSLGCLCSLRARIHKNGSYITDDDVRECLSGNLDWLTGEVSLLNNILENTKDLLIPRISFVHLLGSSYTPSTNSGVSFGDLPPFSLHYAASHFANALQFLLSEREDDVDLLTTPNSDGLLPIECAISNVELDVGNDIIEALFPNSEQSRIKTYISTCEQSGKPVNETVVSLINLRL